MGKKISICVLISCLIVGCSDKTTCKMMVKNSNYQIINGIDTICYVPVKSAELNGETVEMGVETIGEGMYEQGLKVGEWTYKDVNGNVVLVEKYVNGHCFRKEIYKNGKFIRAVILDPSF